MPGLTFLGLKPGVFDLQTRDRLRGGLPHRATGPRRARVLECSGLGAGPPSAPVLRPVSYRTGHRHSAPRSMPGSRAIPLTPAPGVVSYRATA